MEAFEILFTASLWAAAIRIASPLIFGTLGELICERAGVLNRLLADAAPPRLLGRIIGIGRLALQHATRSELLAELFAGVRQSLRFFLGIEVIKIAVELVEAMDGREILVQVSQMVLPELSGRVALVLQELRHCHVAVLKPDWRAGHTDF